VGKADELMRVIVCGSRSYNDFAFVSSKLTDQHELHPFSLVITGGATGVDSLAVQWARAWNIRVLLFPAAWGTFGRMAGPIRNRKMLEEGKPDLVIAFPGGRGTASMVKLAKSRGVRLIEIGAPA
jgi:predicted Rossmann-fold nucleotide-binding protein